MRIELPSFLVSFCVSFCARRDWLFRLVSTDCLGVHDELHPTRLWLFYAALPYPLVSSSKLGLRIIKRLGITDESSLGLDPGHVSMAGTGDLHVAVKCGVDQGNDGMGEGQ